MTKKDMESCTEIAAFSVFVLTYIMMGIFRDHWIIGIIPAAVAACAVGFASEVILNRYKE